jgi:chorismate dehydratase
VVFEDAQNDFSKEIQNNTAAVLIGDRALQQRKISKYIYDLAGEWKTKTGLPFVFAAWIANKKLPEDFVALFNKKNAEGINNIDTVIKQTECSFYDLNIYFKQNISYILNEEKLRGMKLFLELIEQL